MYTRALRVTRRVFMYRVTLRNRVTGYSTEDWKLRPGREIRVFEIGGRERRGLVKCRPVATTNFRPGPESWRKRVPAVANDSLTNRSRGMKVVGGGCRDIEIESSRLSARRFVNFGCRRRFVRRGAISTAEAAARGEAGNVSRR